MKDKVILSFMVLAVYCLILGFVGKIGHIEVIFTNLTWIDLSQTCLLFGIAWAIGRYYESE